MNRFFKDIADHFFEPITFMMQDVSNKQLMAR